MRLAQHTDILDLCHLRVKQQKDDWQEEYSDKFNLLKQTEKYLKKHLNKDLFMFIEEDNNNIIATCGLQIIEYLPQCNDNGKQGYICNIYTEAGYRNNGIQTLLLKEAIKFSKEKELSELNLSTDNKIAINLYKKVGFKFDDLIMRLELLDKKV